MNNRGKVRNRGQRGSALVLALVAVVGVSSLTLALLSTSIASNREGREWVDRERALVLAESGVAEAVAALQMGGTGDVASRAQPAGLGGGVFWVEATDLGNGRTQLVVDALKGSGRASVEVVVEEEGDTLFTAALQSGTGISVKDVQGDSFDSAAGAYAAQLAAGGGTWVNDECLVLSNEDITLTPGAAIWGDAHPGPTYSVANPGAVSGSTASLAEPFTMDPVALPVIPPTGGGLWVPAGDTLVLPPGNYNYDFLEVASGATLIVEDPATIVVTGVTVVGQDALLSVAGGGNAVEIHAVGNVTIDPKADIQTSSLRARDCALYLHGGAAQTVQFKPKAGYYGTLYGPDVDVVTGPNFELFGAMAANNIDFQPSAKVHYDEDLQNLDFVVTGYSLLSSRKLEFTEADLRTNRLDPMLALGLVKSDLQKPADSHQVATGPTGAP